MICREGIELSNVHLVRAVIAPQVEGATEEIAVLLWCDGKVRRLTRLRVAFDARDKLHVSQIILYKKIEHLVGMFDISVIEYDKSAELDVVFFAVFDAAHYLAESACA